MENAGPKENLIKDGQNSIKDLEESKEERKEVGRHYSS